MESTFAAEWKPGSRYEHPIHTTATWSAARLTRWLIMVEAVDPIYSKEPGLNTEVDRVPLYVSRHV